MISWILFGCSRRTQCANIVEWLLRHLLWPPRYFRRVWWRACRWRTGCYRCYFCGRKTNDTTDVGMRKWGGGVSCSRCRDGIIPPFEQRQAM